jgi:chemotaxis protein MotB
MKTNMPALFTICATMMIMTISAAHADLFYWPSEYRTVVNDRDALQIELDTVKVQYRNEKQNYEAKISELNAKIDSLDSQLSDLEKKRKEESSRADEQIRALEARAEILAKNGSDKEKKLIEENKRLKTFYEDQISKLQKQLADEQDANRKKIEDLTVQFDKKRGDYESQIATMTDQIASLKKLSESQKADLDHLSKQANDLEKQLESEIKNGDIKIKRMFNKIIININDRISFDSGSTILRPNVKPALDKIITILKNYPGNKISIEGHTDNVPLVRGALFRDNWELSTERALAVLGYIMTDKNLDPTRFSAAGYGEYQPLVANDTEENKAINRRVDIVVVPDLPVSQQNN